MPDCLHVPIAARDVDAIEEHVGSIIRPLGRGSPANAYLIEAFPVPSKEMRLPIWSYPASDILHQPMQVWVDIRYTRYRVAYRKAFPKEKLAGRVLSHALNRRVAALKGFQYVRITPTSRGANSSSAYSENWSVSHNSDDTRLTRQKLSGAKIQNADLTDLLLMMDFKLGGGVQEFANEGQTLVRPSA